MKIYILCLLLAGVLGHNSDIIKKNFKALDLERDGVIRWKELLSDFNRKDKNVDGYVSLKEYTASPPPGAIPIVVRGSFNFYDKLDGREDGVLHHSVVNYTYEILDPYNKGEVTFADFETNIEQILDGVAKEVQALVNRGQSLVETQHAKDCN